MNSTKSAEVENTVPSFHSKLKARICDSPYKVSVKRHHLLQAFKWFLIGINSIIIFFILIGVFMYFTEVRDDKKFKLFDMTQEESFSDEFSPDFNNTPASSGPKYAWIMSSMTFALLMSIPCLGFIGALKQHTCLLTLYGVIFFVQAFVILIFKSPFFIIFAFIASASLGLVFLIQNTAQQTFTPESVSI